MARHAHWEGDQSPGLRSLNQLLTWCASRGDAAMLCAKHNAAWENTSAQIFYRSVRKLAEGLVAFGLRPGDRAAILSESRPEWLIADFGCLAAGVVDVPIYPTLTADQVAYILRDSGARVAFVSSQEQAEKVKSVAAELPALDWLCCFDEESWRKWITGEPAEPAERFRERMLATPSEQLATLLYTSGTTGTPKGVPLTHANLCANLNVSLIDFDFGINERRLSILPLAHITERHVAYLDMMVAATTYFAESMDTVAQNLVETSPTYLVSVPRLFEKVVAGVRAQAAKASVLRRGIFAWALKIGREAGPFRLTGRRPPAGLRWRLAIADKLVYSKLRVKMGGKLDKIISGGAPLGKELGEFLLAMGVVVDEGYGLSETSPVISLNRPSGRRLGSIGRSLPGVEVEFAADGELLVRGPSVFRGYYNLPEATAEALPDGWFHTGDVGYRDQDGYLYITDRKKDLIKTSGGKFIAPQPIEAKLKASPLIAEAVVVGDGRRFASVLLVPDRQAADAAGLSGEGLRAAVAAEVEKVNAGLARFETLKKFHLLEREFTVQSGELTPTIKVRRRAVERNCAEAIEAMYRDEPS